MHLVLTGATGLVGSAVLHSMLTTPAVSKISILSRRPVAQAEGHAKAHVIIHKDFANYSSVLEQLKDADGVVWAQGISAMVVGKEDYETITHNYPLSFARALSTTTAPKGLPFIYVSGEGATATPGFTTQHWQRIKGLTESDLLALSKDPAHANLRPISLRPGGVLPQEHEEIHPYLPKQNLGIRIIIPVFMQLARLMPGLVSPTRELGKVLMELAMGKGEPMEGKGVSGEGRTLDNVVMRRLAGL